MHVYKGLYVDGGLNKEAFLDNWGQESDQLRVDQSDDCLWNKVGLARFIYYLQ